MPGHLTETFLRLSLEDGSSYVYDVFGAAAAAGISGSPGTNAVVGLTAVDQRFAVDGGLYSVAVSPGMGHVPGDWHCDRLHNRSIYIRSFRPEWEFLRIALPAFHAYPTPALSRCSVPSLVTKLVTSTAFHIKADIVFYPIVLSDNSIRQFDPITSW